MLEAAVAAGVRAPRPVAYLGDVDGREAFAMERVEGETIGRRLVRDPPPGLPLEMADELAKIHAIEPLDFLPRGDAIARFYDELDSVGEPHPAIEYGLAWVRERLAPPRERDVRARRLPARQPRRHRSPRRRPRLGVRARRRSRSRTSRGRSCARGGSARTTRRLGGVGDVEPYLERYNELTGRDITLDELLVWEVFGNVKWAIGCLTQSRRHLNGPGPQRRVRRARADGGRDGVRAARPDRAGGVTRPARRARSWSRRCSSSSREEVLPDAPRSPREVPHARRA